MSRLVEAYLLALFAGGFVWLFYQWEVLVGLLSTSPGLYVSSIMFLYLLSHLFRMMRLAILTLDQRGHMLPLMTAHALTAFPSSLTPLKIGEVLRLGAFFLVYSGRRKALAVWLVERFLDLTVICSLILVIYLLDVDVPSALKLLFIVFFMAGSLAVIVFFSVAKTFVFINRYLVLSSHTQRGLRLLKLSHALRQLELSIYGCMQGRLAGLLLISIAVWLTEVLVIYMLLSGGTVDIKNVAEYFVRALSGIVPGSTVEFTILYALCQSLVLLALAAVFSIGIVLSRLAGREEGSHGG